MIQLLLSAVTRTLEIWLRWDLNPGPPALLELVCFFFVCEAVSYKTGALNQTKLRSRDCCMGGLYLKFVFGFGLGLI